jgi:hypothetical protein
MHAMLALAASELALTEASPQALNSSAISHRVSAIQSLNKAISQGLQTFEEGNAMLATCYSLIFQSTLIDDGLVEYMTFIRGVVLLSSHMGANNIKFLFHSMFGEEQTKKLDPKLEESPLIDPDLVDAACASLEALAPLCTRNSEREYRGLLLSLARSLYSSSREGTQAPCKHD